MPHPASKNDCSAISGGLFDLNLPMIKVAEEPPELARPTLEAQMANAAFLLKSQPADFYPAWLAAMNPEPFPLD